MKLRLWHYFTLLIALLLLPSCILFVEQTEYVYVTQFGRPVITYDGKVQAGLHWKLPWPLQSATRFDRRIQAFDIPTQEYLILDRDTSGEEKPIPLTFDLFICWRIGSLNQQDDREAVDRFVRSFGSTDRAEQYLRTQVVSRLKQQLSQIVLHDLLNVDASQVKIEKITSNVAKAVTPANAPESSLEKQASKVGIELIDIRLRRFNHPVLVRDDIYAKIR
ncbi:MAG TPA: SPFH domain-containing protein, partial [Gemmatales bacterium]|nr:SPFH domain-containing protein [Gemmatales bacterium]